MDQFEDIRPLGRGAYAVVHLVRRKVDGTLFVMKRFHTPLVDLNVRERQEIAQEIKLLAHLHHQNVIAFYDSIVDGGIMHIVMEYASGGTLSKCIAAREGALFEEDEIWEMFVQIVEGLKYVHSCSVLHRDLKSENIMLTGPQHRVIKIADFGVSRILGGQADMAASIVGTPHILSPELCQGLAYDQKSDIWALGCILYEMCALHKPFDATNMPAIIFSIMRNRPAALPAEYSESLRLLVASLLQPDPAERPTAADIAALPIVQRHLRKWQETLRLLLEEEAGGSAPVLPTTTETAAMAAMAAIAGAAPYDTASSGVGPYSAAALPSSTHRGKGVAAQQQSALHSRLGSSVTSTASTPSLQSITKVPSFRGVGAPPPAAAAAAVVVGEGLGVAPRCAQVISPSIARTTSEGGTGTLSQLPIAPSEPPLPPPFADDQLLQLEPDQQQQRREQQQQQQTGDAASAPAAALPARTSAADELAQPSVSAAAAPASSVQAAQQLALTHPFLSSLSAGDLLAQLSSSGSFVQPLKAAALDAEIMADLKAAQDAGQARNIATALGTISALQTRAEALGPLASDRLWEALGRSWADCGSFNNAIYSFRRALRVRGASSLAIMEQLGNLLVRRAQQVWAQARSGDLVGAWTAAEEALQGSAAASLVQHQKLALQRAEAVARDKGEALPGAPTEAGPIGEAHLAAPYATSFAQQASTGTLPPWAVVASALMYEGVGYIERMCSLGSTAERRALLGSAYKRRAWTGLGTSRREDLVSATANYAIAHEIELKEGATYPSPYAKLNQITLEMLSGTGRDEEKKALITAATEAEAWAIAQREDEPADVWGWVQVVDARCLRYLLGDPSVTLDAIVKDYREQFAFGASHRVKSSVLDQFNFFYEVLRGLQTEAAEEIAAEEKRLVAIGMAALAPPATALATGDLIVHSSSSSSSVSSAPLSIVAPSSPSSATAGSGVGSLPTVSVSLHGIRPKSPDYLAALRAAFAWEEVLLTRVTELRTQLLERPREQSVGRRGSAFESAEIEAIVARASQSQSPLPAAHKQTPQTPHTPQTPQPIQQQQSQPPLPQLPRLSSPLHQQPGQATASPLPQTPSARVLHATPSGRALQTSTPSTRVPVLARLKTSESDTAAAGPPLSSKPESPLVARAMREGGASSPPTPSPSSSRAFRKDECSPLRPQQQQPQQQQQESPSSGGGSRESPLIALSAPTPTHTAGAAASGSSSGARMHAHSTGPAPGSARGRSSIRRNSARGVSTRDGGAPLTPGRPGTMAVELFSPRGVAAFAHSHNGHRGFGAHPRDGGDDSYERKQHGDDSSHERKQQLHGGPHRRPLELSNKAQLSVGAAASDATKSAALVGVYVSTLPIDTRGGSSESAVAAATSAAEDAPAHVSEAGVSASATPRKRTQSSAHMYAESWPQPHVVSTGRDDASGVAAGARHARATVSLTTIESTPSATPRDALSLVPEPQTSRAAAASGPAASSSIVARGALPVVESVGPHPRKHVHGADSWPQTSVPSVGRDVASGTPAGAHHVGATVSLSNIESAGGLLGAPNMLRGASISTARDAAAPGVLSARPALKVPPLSAAPDDVATVAYGTGGGSTEDLPSDSVSRSALSVHHGRKASAFMKASPPVVAVPPSSGSEAPSTGDDRQLSTAAASGDRHLSTTAAAASGVGPSVTARRVPSPITESAPPPAVLAAAAPLAAALGSDSKPPQQPQQHPAQLDVPFAAAAAGAAAAAPSPLIGMTPRKQRRLRREVAIAAGREEFLRQKNDRLRGASVASATESPAAAAASSSPASMALLLGAPSAVPLPPYVFRGTPSAGAEEQQRLVAASPAPTARSSFRATPALTTPAVTSPSPSPSLMISVPASVTHRGGGVNDHGAETHSVFSTPMVANGSAAESSPFVMRPAGAVAAATAEERQSLSWSLQQQGQQTQTQQGQNSIRGGATGRSSPNATLLSQPSQGDRTAAGGYAIAKPSWANRPELAEENESETPSSSSAAAYRHAAVQNTTPPGASSSSSDGYSTAVGHQPRNFVVTGTATPRPSIDMVYLQTAATPVETAVPTQLRVTPAVAAAAAGVPAPLSSGTAAGAPTQFTPPFLHADVGVFHKASPVVIAKSVESPSRPEQLQPLQQHQAHGSSASSSSSGGLPPAVFRPVTFPTVPSSAAPPLGTAGSSGSSPQAAAAAHMAHMTSQVSPSVSEGGPSLSGGSPVKIKTEFSPTSSGGGGGGAFSTLAEKRSSPLSHVAAASRVPQQQQQQRTRTGAPADAAAAAVVGAAVGAVEVPSAATAAGGVVGAVAELPDAQMEGSLSTLNQVLDSDTRNNWRTILLGEGYPASPLLPASTTAATPGDVIDDHRDVTDDHRYYPLRQQTSSASSMVSADEGPETTPRHRVHSRLGDEGHSRLGDEGQPAFEPLMQLGQLGQLTPGGAPSVAAPLSTASSAAPSSTGTTVIRRTSSSQISSSTPLSGFSNAPAAAVAAAAAVAGVESQPMSIITSTPALQPQQPQRMEQQRRKIDEPSDMASSTTTPIATATAAAGDVQPSRAPSRRGSLQLLQPSMSLSPSPRPWLHPQQPPRQQQLDQPRSKALLPGPSPVPGALLRPPPLNAPPALSSLESNATPAAWGQLSSVSNFTPSLARSAGLLRLPSEGSSMLQRPKSEQSKELTPIVSVSEVMRHTSSEQTPQATPNVLPPMASKPMTAAALAAAAAAAVVPPTQSVRPVPPKPLNVEAISPLQRIPTFSQMHHKHHLRRKLQHELSVKATTSRPHGQSTPSMTPAAAAAAAAAHAGTVAAPLSATGTAITPATSAASATSMQQLPQASPDVPSAEADSGRAGSAAASSAITQALAPGSRLSYNSALWSDTIDNATPTLSVGVVEGTAAAPVTSSSSSGLIGDRHRTRSSDSLVQQGGAHLHPPTSFSMTDVAIAPSNASIAAADANAHHYIPPGPYSSSSSSSVRSGLSSSVSGGFNEPPSSAYTADRLRQLTSQQLGRLQASGYNPFARSTPPSAKFYPKHVRERMADAAAAAAVAAAATAAAVADETALHATKPVSPSTGRLAGTAAESAAPGALDQRGGAHGAGLAADRPVVLSHTMTTAAGTGAGAAEALQREAAAAAARERDGCVPVVKPGPRCGCWGFFQRR